MESAQTSRPHRPWVKCMWSLRSVHPGWIGHAVLAAVGFEGVAVGQWGDQAILPEESVGVLFEEVARGEA